MLIYSNILFYLLREKKAIIRIRTLECVDVYSIGERYNSRNNNFSIDFVC